jgi:hypothetical protein
VISSSIAQSLRAEIAETLLAVSRGLLIVTRSTGAIAVSNPLPAPLRRIHTDAQTVEVWG